MLLIGSNVGSVSVSPVVGSMIETTPRIVAATILPDEGSSVMRSVAISCRRHLVHEVSLGVIVNATVHEVDDEQATVR